MSGVDEKFVNEVLRVYDEAILATPDDWQIRYNLGTFLHQLKRFPEATEHLEYVVNTFPDVTAFRMLLGYSLAQSGYFDQAISHFCQVLELDEGNKTAKEAIDWVLEQKKKQASPAKKTGNLL